MHFTHLFIIVVVYALGFLPAWTTAQQCSKFEITEINFPSVKNETQRITPGFTCQSSKTDCDYGVSSQFKTIHGCSLQAEGQVSAAGYTNISVMNLSISKQAYLFHLVSEELRSRGSLFNGHGILQQATECINQASFQPWCVKEGDSVYGEFRPEVRCVEGIVSGCAGDGIRDGEAIKVCGLIRLENGISHYHVDLKHITAKLARNLTDNPAVKAGECGAKPKSGASLPASWLISPLGALTAATVFFIFL